MANLFSESLGPFEQQIENQDLINSLTRLQRILSLKDLNLLVWDENHISVQVPINVPLPPLGTFNDVDIRALEPVLVVFNKAEYPATSPYVFTDRMDFPKNQLPHLFIAKPNQPPRLCLVRDSMNEWYSNKGIRDVMIRTENWFRDAAAGTLSEDGNQFDPVRLEGYSGIIIYDYDTLAKIVREKAAFVPGCNFAICMFERHIVDDLVTYKLTDIITDSNEGALQEKFKSENEKSNTDINKKHYHFGYVIWSHDVQTHNDYFIDFPSNLESLRKFCNDFSVNFKEVEEFIASHDPNTYLNIPLIVSIFRPKPIIGFSDSIEFINFILRVDSIDIIDGRFITNVPVKLQSHNQPLSIKLAEVISGFNLTIDKYSLVFGCGALGSKIIMHLARSGYTKLLLVDPDIISPHNLVRHSLLSNSEGLNKAISLVNEIKRMFPNNPNPPIPIANHANRIFEKPKILQSVDFVFDFTASNAFSNFLSKVEIPEDIKVSQAYISDFGNLGIMLVEGKNRNPRIDDLKIILASKYKSIPFIKEWLQREMSKESSINYHVGIGCNSETTIISDDIVSLHASYFSGLIKNNQSKNIDSLEGNIYLNQIHYNPYFHNSTYHIIVPKLNIYWAKNNSSWQIRMLPDALEKIIEKAKSANNLETGGILIGVANSKVKIIHVIDILDAPEDSKGTTTTFIRGIKGLPQEIDDIFISSGNQFGYIGEWHSHPNGPSSLSPTDMATVIKHKIDNFEVNVELPIFLIIVTQDEAIPYVF